jgi:hypothetical protein
LLLIELEAAGITEHDKCPNRWDGCSGQHHRTLYDLRGVPICTETRPKLIERKAERCALSLKGLCTLTVDKHGKGLTHARAPASAQPFPPYRLDLCGAVRRLLCADLPGVCSARRSQTLPRAL